MKKNNYHRADNICSNYIVSVGLLGPGVDYLPVYWACDPSRGQGSVRGGEVFVRRDSVDG